MILKSNKEEIIKKNFDICIIGSGIAASSLALELMKTNFTFILVEAGGLEGNSDKLIQKEISGRKFGVELTNSIEVGGTSSLWHGVLAPLDRIDFKKRSWIRNSGWPIKYEDLEKYYSRASKIFNLNHYDFFNIKNLPTTFINILSSLKFNKRKLENKIFQRPMPVVRFKKIIYSKLVKSNHNHMIYNTAALELIHNNSENIENLICGDEFGKKFSISASKFIISAGALETPRLLLNSKIQNKNIGKYLMDHPMGSLYQIKFKNKQSSKLFNYYNHENIMIKVGFTFSENIQEKIKLPNHCFYMRAAFTKDTDSNFNSVSLSLSSIKSGKISIKNLLNIFFHPKLVFSIIAIKLKLKTKYTDLFFITEQIPNEKSNVSLSPKRDKFGYPIAKIDWKLLKDDELSITKSLDILKNNIFDSIDYVDDNYNLGWDKIYTSASHHLGTARMSDSQNNGVVDRNLKVFNYNNLYVCDSSVFPTSGNANSGLTISALACRLVDYLNS